jgi:hypothetical protein
MDTLDHVALEGLRSDDEKSLVFATFLRGAPDAVSGGVAVRLALGQSGIAEPFFQQV